MADWLEHREDLTPQLARLLKVISDTPHLDWLLLTKRPENWRLLVDRAYHWAQGARIATQMVYKWLWRGEAPANIWIGTTAEDQQRAEERIPALMRIPARVRFLSCEPLLGPVELRTIEDEKRRYALSLRNPDNNKIHWVIAGGESGHHARPMHPEWLRGLRDQCKVAKVPFFFKQWGEWSPDPMAPFSRVSRVGKAAAGRLLDGREWSEFPTGETA